MSLNGFRHDGRGDAGDGQFAEGRVDVALECPRGLGVMARDPFLLLHCQPYARDSRKGVVACCAGFRPVDAALGDRVFIFAEQCFDLGQLDTRRCQGNGRVGTDGVNFLLAVDPVLDAPGGSPGRREKRCRPPPSGSFFPRAS